jgi:hypothetical protein
MVKQQTITVFLGNFWMQPKWQLSTCKCTKSGDDPQDDLANSGYTQVQRHVIKQTQNIEIW